MESRPQSHPSDRVLRSFSLGKVDEESARDVLSHLTGCRECREKVTSQSGDSFLHGLRAARVSAAGTPAPAMTLTASPAPTPLAGAGLPKELADDPNYEILRELGRGGMGVVYLARDVLMDRKVVLKVVAAAHLDRPETRERFVGEIRAAARLDHPNVVKAHAVFQAGELLAFVMEYVEGEDLYRLVEARGPLPIANACYYAYQAALGLQHAHEKGMVHRDIKPHNLILARGKRHQVKVLDFGLAKATSEKGRDRGLTVEGQMLGTPDYVAPEQTLDAASATIRADVYSLGCTLYFLLTGRPPFRGRTPFEVMRAHHTETATPLEGLRPDAPCGLGAALRTMMAKDPGARYQTPGEVARALLPYFREGTAADPRPAAAGAATGEPAACAATLPDDPDGAPPAGIETPFGDLNGRVFTLTHTAGRKKRASLRRRARYLAIAAVFAALFFAGGAATWTAADNGEVLVPRLPPGTVAEITRGGKPVRTLRDHPGGPVALPRGTYQIAFARGGEDWELSPGSFTVERGGRAELAVVPKAKPLQGASADPVPAEPHATGPSPDAQTTAADGAERGEDMAAAKDPPPAPESVQGEETAAPANAAEPAQPANRETPAPTPSPGTGGTGPVVVPADPPVGTGVVVPVLIPNRANKPPPPTPGPNARKIPPRPKPPPKGRR